VRILANLAQAGAFQVEEIQPISEQAVLELIEKSRQDPSLLPSMASRLGAGCENRGWPAPSGSRWRNAKFGQPEVKPGFAFPAAAVRNVYPRLVGKGRRAWQLILSRRD